MRRLMELCKVGEFMSGNKKVTVTKRHLSEAVETYKGGAPWTIGHLQDETLPKLGGVESVVLSDNGNTMVGVVDFNELGEKVHFEMKLYDRWSPCLMPGSDGKYYLHHIAGLGEVPPAIKDLAHLGDLPLNLSDPNIPTVQFDNSVMEEGVFLLSAPAPENNDKEKDSMDKTVEDLEKELAAEKQKSASLEKEKGILLSDKEAAQKEQQAEAVKRIKDAAQGKIPAGKIPELIALADSLPTDEVEVEGDDGKKEKVSPVAILERMLKGLRDLLDEGEAINLSDNPIKNSSSQEEDLSGLMGCM